MSDHPNPGEESGLDAIELFADFVARRDAGDEVSFDELLRDHPEQADELQAMHADWQDAIGVVGELGPGTAEPTDRREHARGSLEGVRLVPGEELGALIGRLPHFDPSHPRYEILEEVAHGSMGTVLKVWDDDLHRQLAMKVILDEEARRGAADSPSQDPRSVARFLEEAQVTGQLDHPGIVPVHELGVDEHGCLFFTMKLVRGRTLYEIFRRVHEGKEGWTVTRALTLILKACESMTYAHSKGVIHRDLKPSNVMVGRFGEVYVMDWGLARVLGREDTKDIRLRQPQEPPTVELRTHRQTQAEEQADSPLMTLDGDVVGTPAYMPPEQAEGLIEELEPRADVYAVGAMLYHLLTGREPYTEPSRRNFPYVILARVLDGPPRPVAELAPDTPAELVAICERAMARRPEDRYADMSALGEDLRAYLEGRVVRAYQTGARAEFQKWVTRNPVASRLAGIALVLAMAAVGLGVWAVSSWDEVKAAEAAREAEAREDALERGFLHLGDREAELAREVFEAVLAEGSAPPEAVAGLVLAHLRRDDPHAALAVLDRFPAVLENHAGLRRLEIAAVNVDIRHRGGEAALVDYGRRLEEAPRDFRALVGTTLAHLETGDEAAARQLVDRDFSLLKELPAFRFVRLAVLERDRSNSGLSMAEWQRRRLPEAHGALEHYLVGASLIATDEGLREAAGHFTTAILETRDRPRALYYYEALRVAAQLQGTVYSERAGKSREDVNRVHELAKAILEIWPDSPGAAENIASAYSNCRNLDPGVLDDDRFDRVVQTLARKSEAHPDDPEALSNHARILWLRGAFDEAVRVQHEAIAIDPSAGRYMELAVIHLESGYKHEALELVREALRVDPLRSTAWNQLGNIRHDHGDHAGALEAFRRCEELLGPDANAAFNCGISLMRLGRFDEAERDFRRSMELNERRGAGATAYPYSTHLERLQELRAIEGCEEAIAAGTLQLATPEQYRLHAEYCLARGHHALAARLWHELFDAPRGPLPEYCYLAAGTAALAAADLELSAADRSFWRRKGLAWLEIYYGQLFQAYRWEDPWTTTRLVRDLAFGFRHYDRFAGLRAPLEDEASEEDRRRCAAFQEWMDGQIEELGL